MMRIRAAVGLFFVSAVLVLCALGTVSAQVSRPQLLGPGVNAEGFFDDTKLHSIFISINSKDWQSLRDHFLDNTYYQCDMKWQDITVRNIGIRSRGTGSRDATKPGLRVDFDRYTTDQKFLNLKSFILRNNTQDASGMHERLAMALARKIGIAEASREAHAKLFINNEYWGLYTIVENVDKTFLKRIYGDDNGYLFKYDFNVGDSGYYYEDRGDDPGLYVPSPFKPETHESDARPEYVRDFIRIVNQAGGDTFRSQIASFIRWPNFLKHIAVENFVADQDGFNGNYGTNNFYWQRFDNQNLFTWILWDKSEAFKDPVTLSIVHNVEEGAPPEKRNRLSRQAFGFPDLRNQYFDALVSLANAASETIAGDSRGWLEREVERIYAQTRQAQLDDTKKPYTNDQFEADVNVLRTFARQRSSNVLSQVGALR